MRDLPRSRFPARRLVCSGLAPGLLLLVPAGPAPARSTGAGLPAERPLRVCADPNNLPYSNRAREGFENRIAELVAREMDSSLRYTWWPQRRGYVRKTLGAHACDVLMGVPTDDPLVLTTRPYYRSTYVFVTRRHGGPRVRSLDDPVLRRVRVGVQLIGDDMTNTPPAHALARRGIVRNVVGFPVYGDYGRPDPTAAIVRAVAGGEVDVAVVWGPQAGYYAQRSPVPLALTPVVPAVDPPGLRFAFDISAGVRRGDTALRRELDAALARHRREIAAILARYDVPRVGPAAGS